ncbi:MAG TPA: hypothetical protein VK524_11100 [Polyangiaceae bacterium]|nr:hypothetical protein [Polyangiaceae bacterium]
MLVVRASSPKAGYLANLNTARTVLWCYLIWYLVVLARYFDGTPSLWLTSLGLSGIIGTGLYLNTAHSGKTRTPLGRWQILRLYLMPFCVSSFAALIKGRNFWLVFHPDLEGNAVAVAACAAFCAAVWLAKRLHGTEQPVQSAGSGI